MTCRHGRQRGAAAILVAFLLLTLMAAAGFATSRNLTRELGMAGEALQGALAASAAEAGLDWFLAQAPGAGGVARVPGLATPKGLPHESADGALRQSFELRIRRLGALPRQGMAPGGEAGGEVEPMAEPAAEQTIEQTAEQLWLVTSVGHSALEGRVETRFTQVRELLVADSGDRPGGLRILAWIAPGW